MTKVLYSKRQNKAIIAILALSTIFYNYLYVPDIMLQRAKIVVHKKKRYVEKIGP